MSGSKQYPPFNNVPDVGQYESLSRFDRDTARMFRLIRDEIKTTFRDLYETPAARMTLAVSQAFAAAAATVVNLDTVTYDSHSYWDATNFKLFLKKPGYWWVAGALNLNVNFAAGNASAFLFLNGAQRSQATMNVIAGAQFQGLQISDLFRTAVGGTDYVQLVGNVPAGSLTPFFQSGTGTFLAAHWLGYDPTN